MAVKKMGSYFDEHITKQMPVEYTEDDLELTNAINTSRTVAALEKQVALYEKEVEEIKRTTRITKWAAIVSAIIGAISIVATVASAVISTADFNELQELIQLYFVGGVT